MHSPLYFVIAYLSIGAYAAPILQPLGSRDNGLTTIDAPITSRDAMKITATRHDFDSDSITGRRSWVRDPGMDNARVASRLDILKRNEVMEAKAEVLDASSTVRSARESSRRSHKRSPLSLIPTPNQPSSDIGKADAANTDKDVKPTVDTTPDGKNTHTTATSGDENSDNSEDQNQTSEQDESKAPSSGQSGQASKGPQAKAGTGLLGLFDDIFRKIGTESEHRPGQGSGFHAELGGSWGQCARTNCFG